jgi:hypothetical protein
MKRCSASSSILPMLLNPHSPDDALSFGTDGAIQI